ncbi:cleavage stimulation factor subunit 1-like isoform X2 [Eriocheir sinensis]|uniref:cleavage stimulation factor subunit 1-like isoform X2 n=1 Tax=Eriocheir sinensis TaxID=95602 RepID=UPI0021C5941B|nr:cleavage stimulation factor subunit 1-like isoform X2 [Eriocheir sinensis]XP_050703200.1 cleavage stimulation factor subunit 1-like isoform X2 [Eriocheir sinensis]XP_050703201.1 cleavage stimulation factor subunit 1-like isoform X2 [Eriocheir sinensis]
MYILSSVLDSIVKLWELSTGRCLIAYTGAGSVGRQEHSAHAMFSHTEDFVMFPDEATTSLCAWDARNAQRKNLLSLGHNGPVRHMVHSPCSPAFITCSDDYWARFWYRRNVH